MQTELSSIKSGYLKQKFLLFHLCDKTDQDFELHYHEFKKIIFFIAGDVTYLIEGKSYQLIAGDLLFINDADIHKPVINSSISYERIILWLHNDFFSNVLFNTTLLAKAFDLATTQNFHLLRLSPTNQNKIHALLLRLAKASANTDFADDILAHALCLEYLVYLNRLQSEFIEQHPLTYSMPYDQQIETLLKYIQENLANDISIKTLTQKFFLSRSYLMHKFKTEVGCTIHTYIQEKRLLKALQLLKAGTPIIEIAPNCGFADYSTFLRAFKRKFSLSPRHWLLINK